VTGCEEIRLCLTKLEMFNNCIKQTNKLEKNELIDWIAKWVSV